MLFIVWKIDQWRKNTIPFGVLKGIFYCVYSFFFTFFKCYASPALIWAHSLTKKNVYPLVISDRDMKTVQKSLRNLSKPQRTFPAIFSTFHDTKFSKTENIKILSFNIARKKKSTVHKYFLSIFFENLQYFESICSQCSFFF